MVFNQPENHFDLFGLPISFALDTLILDEHYRELQKITHPDKYANRSAQEQRIALQQSMQINEAYNTLRNPLTRALYLLELHDIDTPQTTIQDSEFLIQQMMLRERLAEVKQATVPQTALEELIAEIRRMRKTQLEALAIQFDSIPPKSPAATQTCIAKIHFLDKLLYEADQITAELEEKI